MDAAVRAENLHKRYGETVALDGVSLSVAQGEVFGLVGPNGAGKTTLVRTLTGTIEPDDGEVSLLDGPPRNVARDRIGLLPQDFRPHGRLTARELVSYYRGLYADGQDPEDSLAAVGLEDAADTRYENLSGGQQRRTCVATALVNDPDVLFLDEPTTGIDPAGRRTLWRLLEDLAAGGTTVVLTTHYMEEAERLADRVGLLADGKLASVGPPGELIAEYGGSSRLVVETGAEPESLSGTELAVESGRDGLVFPDLQPAEIGAVVEALESAGVEYGSLTWTEPDLEDVYLELTGERFDPWGESDSTAEDAAEPQADAEAVVGGER